MNGSKIVLHHIGARWGNQTFPRLAAFADEFVEVLYEADGDAIPTIRQAWKQHPGELVVIQAALADVDGEAVLHVNVNPGLTSLHKLGDVLAPRYQHMFGVDFDFGAAAGAREVERRKIATRRLDTVIADTARRCPPPDFMMLDVQAAEHEVLQGAPVTLADHVCGLIAEVEFWRDVCRPSTAFRRSMTSSTRPVSISCAFSRSAKARCVGRSDFAARATKAGATRFFYARSSGCPTTPARRTAMLTKLCFFALVFGAVELAVQCLQALRGVPLGEERGLSNVSLRCAARRMRATPSSFRRCFLLSCRRKGVTDYSQSSNPAQWPALFEGLRGFDAAYLATLKSYEARRDSPFEAVLRRHGLVDVAETVKRVRRGQARKIRGAILASQGRAGGLRTKLRRGAKRRSPRLRGA